MTAGVDESPRDRHGELVTVNDLELVFAYKEGPWVEVVPPDSEVGFTVHESEIHP